MHGFLRIVAAAAALPIVGACSAHARTTAPMSASTGSPVVASTTAAAASATSAAACRQGDLVARFVGGGLATGNDFGSIVIWNKGSTPCRISGSVEFTAFFTGGRRDAYAQPNRPLLPIDVALPASMAAFQDGEDSSPYLTASLMGPERDDPSQPDALCRQDDKLAPAVLVLRLGKLAFRVTNSDPHSGQVTRVYGCHGRVLLEDVGRGA